MLEGRPSALDFNEAKYLSIYPDVRDSVAKGHFLCGYEHFLRHGQAEGRVRTDGAFMESVTLPLPVDFDWANYLMLNIDLVEGRLYPEHCVTDHFRHHGLREARPYLIRETPIEGGSEKTMPVFLFYHVYCVNDWKEVFREQMDMIVQSGLYGFLDRVHVNLVGGEDDLKWVKQHASDEKQVVKIVADAYEFPTLDMMADASRGEVFKGLYIHTKGVYYPPGNWGKKVRSFWRHVMNHQVIHLWRECHRLIQGHDLVGTFFKKGNTATDMYWRFDAETHVPSTVNFTDHFSGNFFWFDSRYFSRIERLTPAQKAIRFNAEWLPFRNHPDKCEVFFDLALMKSRLLDMFVDT